MSDIQPMPVAGYTPQSESTIQAVNRNKLVEEHILRLCDQLAKRPDIDGRWLAIAKTHFQQGFMAANRALFKPQRLDAATIQHLEATLPDGAGTQA